jgi:acetylcholinesterase
MQFHGVDDQAIADRYFKSVALAFQPLADGVFLTDNPQQLVLRKEAAKIPFVTGLYPLVFLHQFGQTCLYR